MIQPKRATFSRQEEQFRHSEIILRERKDSFSAKGTVLPLVREECRGGAGCISFGLGGVGACHWVRWRKENGSRGHCSCDLNGKAVLSTRPYQKAVNYWTSAEITGVVIATADAAVV